MENINKKVEYMTIGMDIFTKIMEEVKKNALNESDVFRILGVLSEYISDIQNLEYKTKSSLLETKWVWKSEKYPSSIQLNNE